MEKVSDFGKFISCLFDKNTVKNSDTQFFTFKIDKSKSNCLYLKNKHQFFLCFHQNNFIYLFDAKQEIASIIGDLFRIDQSENVELRNKKRATENGSSCAGFSCYFSCLTKNLHRK